MTKMKYHLPTGFKKIAEFRSRKRTIVIAKTSKGSVYGIVFDNTPDSYPLVVNYIGML